MRSFRKRFQITDETKICLPRHGKKACAFTHGHMCFYEADFLCGLCFPIHLFIHELLDYFKIAPGQLVPNAWQTVLSVMSIWVYVHDGSMVKLNEFLYLYRLKPSTHYGYFEFQPSDRTSRVVHDLPSFFRDQKSIYFFVYGKGWETISDDVWGKVPRLPCTWGISTLGAFFPFFWVFQSSKPACLPFSNLFLFATKVRPRLKS